MNRAISLLMTAMSILCAAPALAGAGATSVGATQARQVDRLLAEWNRPGVPGAAVMVIRDGKALYKRGVGMASIEHGAPITPATPFHVASMSKQFTAFAIHLLARDGKLSLDDDIRTYLPELPDFGKAITVRHLLHHTSGLRDQWNLLTLAGWRMDDVITEDDILGLVKRQQALNFEPGQRYLYSNTGYTLLAVIVKRVAGEPLPLFAEKRIFKPLGMTRTHFHDNYGALVKGRALSYGPSTAGNFYEYVALSYSTVGATSLFTTVEDLALWDRNFYKGGIGGAALLGDMQTPGVLANGKPINYASGLVVAAYRGLTTVSHAGADAGYRSELLRFPDQRFSVAILANAADLDTYTLSHRIADIYLARELKPVSSTPQAVRPPAPANGASVAVDAISAADLSAFVGDYALAPDSHLSFSVENGKLMVKATGQQKYAPQAIGKRAFFLTLADAAFIFDAADKDGVVGGGVLRRNGRDIVARRVSLPLLDEAQLAPYVGEFYNDELHVLYTLSGRSGKLLLSYPRGEFVLDKVGPNVFAAEYPFGRIAFQCEPDGGGCSSFTVNDGQPRTLQFIKVTIAPVKPARPAGTAAMAAPSA